jgi:dienelactone hydrolase
VAGCSSGDSDDSQSAATTTTVAATTPTRFAVERLDETYVDTSRVTPANGDVAEKPDRTLPTNILYPKGSGPFPLVVFSHGLGGSYEYYEPLMQKLAAAGYVVAAPRFPLTYAGAPGGPNGADVQQQPGDVSFVIDQVLAASKGGGPLAGLVDPDAIALAGHSNGAITTLGAVANSCCREPRAKAAVVFAGTTGPYAGGEYDLADAPPLLLVHGTKDLQLAYEGAVTMFNDARGPKGLLTLTGQDHGKWLAKGAVLDGVADATTSFLDAYLRGDTEAANALAAFKAPGMTLKWVPEEGSTMTIPTVPRPEGKRSATATPTTGLTDGQLVTVSWKGFNRNGTINIVQCSGDGKTGGTAACDLNDAYILRPDPTGEGTAQIDMVVGPVGTGTCDATHPCMIVVNDSALTAEEAIIRIPVTFAG